MIQKQDLHPLTYADFGHLLETLTDRVSAFCREQSTRIDAVAPILRSGAFPGCHLASRLNISDLVPLQYKHTYDPVAPIHCHFSIPSPAKNLENATLLLADTNTVTGEIAQRAVADLHERWPSATILLASVMLDVSLASIPGIQALLCAQRTNERRTLSTDAALAAGISNDICIFPWEDLEQQWTEIQAAQSAIQREP